MYEINKGIEIPEMITKSKYPLREMEVGDSFLIPKEDFNGKEARKIACSVMGCARQKRMKERKFSSRCLEEGVRIWRIE
jgi:hypothetical protein